MNNLTMMNTRQAMRVKFDSILGFSVFWIILVWWKRALIMD